MKIQEEQLENEEKNQEKITEDERKETQNAGDRAVFLTTARDSF